MRCLILDDEEPARRELLQLLSLHPEVEVVGQAHDVETALRLTREHRPDAVFLDIQLAGEGGFDFAARVERPGPGLIFVTAHDRYAVEAFRANGLDYLLKPVEPAQLEEALRRVAERKGAAFAVPVDMQREVLRSLGLTLREAEVLFWIAHGKSNPEIAGLLSNSSETVKKQVQRIFDRLGVDNRLAAALIALRHLGLLSE